MVGFKKVEKYDSSNSETPKHKRKNLFFRLGHRISRAFHRTHHEGTSKRINKCQHSRSTGDLINDVQSKSHKPVTTHERLQDHSDPRKSIGADDRANSVGHIHGACASGALSSGSERSNPSFLPSGFRDELNSKLRLRPSHETSNLRDRAGTKSADSCTSLASNDSFLCTTNTTSPMLSCDSATPSTHESHAATSASPFGPVCTNLVGMQHKLAVSRQRRRRPPTRPDWGDADSGEQSESAMLTPLNMGCTQFFASPVSSTISPPFSHLPMDLISEEGCETEARGIRAIPVKASESSLAENCKASDQDDRMSPVAPPRTSLKSVWTPKQNATLVGSSKITGNRPVSMFIPPSATTVNQPSDQHHHHEHQRSAPGPLLSTEKHHVSQGPKKPPRIKSQSTSEHPHEADSPHSFDFEQTTPTEIKSTNDQFSDHCASLNKNMSGTPCAPPKDFPSENSPMNERTPVARPRSKLSAKSKVIPTLSSNEGSGDCAPERPVLKPSSSCVRPVSMFAPNAAEVTRPRDSALSDSSSTHGSRGSLEASRSKSPAALFDNSHGAEEAPERTSVADRAALFGAKLHTTKPQLLPTDSSLPVGRPKDGNDR
ncbi:hypothetical protein FGIG_06145, partial [Fasciola gigantica]